MLLPAVTVAPGTVPRVGHVDTLTTCMADLRLQPLQRQS